MELSVLYSRALAGMMAPLVQVETHLSNGLPSFNIVGLPETAVREARDRVRSAIINSHFEFPDRRITVNLAPADLPKEGGRFDLPIALGILTASGQIPAKQLHKHEFLGELALDGGLRQVPGVVSAALASRESERALVLPPGSAGLAARVPGATVLAADDLLTLGAHLNGAATLLPTAPAAELAPPEYPDLGDVVGQSGARRALEIAASGGHHLLFIGPPGTGKSLLASRLPGLLPPPALEEALTAMALHNYRDSRAVAAALQRPFRQPHHSASPLALVGGGTPPRPGEISLAHGGVLFLDELPEFSRHSLEMLREPMESGEVNIARARQNLAFPARFQLVAAMNPCPCGYLGDPDRRCRCSPAQIKRYQGKISGPLLDRIDLQVPVSRLPPGALLGGKGEEEGSDDVRQRVTACRERQLQRQGCANAALNHTRLSEACSLPAPLQHILEKTALRLGLSGRALHRCLRVARTLADMEDKADIVESHLHEALAYRSVELAPAP